MKSLRNTVSGGQRICIFSKIYLFFFLAVHSVAEN